jgi:hypothetical protein
MHYQHSRIILPETWIDEAKKICNITVDAEVASFRKTLDRASSFTGFHVNESIPRLRKLLATLDLVTEFDAGADDTRKIPLAHWLVKALNSGLPLGEIKLVFPRSDRTEATTDALATSPFVFQALADLAAVSIHLFVSGKKPQVFRAADERYAIGVLWAKDSIVGASNFAVLCEARPAAEPPKQAIRKPPDPIDEVINCCNY